MQSLKSYLCGQWQSGEGSEREAQDANTGEVIATVTTEGLDMGAAARYAREVGGPNLRSMTFHERANMLKALAKHLLANKAALYDLSSRTGATKKDSWVDIEGGAATLFAYSSMARNQMPNDIVWPEDELIPLSREGGFAARHILTSKQGLALHINAFNFPCWGMLEKLAPCWIAGVPAIVKPGTPSAYLTEAMVREMVDSGLLPDGALQLICGGVGDLFDHLDFEDVVTFTGSASTGRKLKTHPRIIEKSIPFNMEADSLNCAILGADVTPGMPEFDLYIKEVIREMTVKAGQKCTAIRRAIVPEAQVDAVRDALLKRMDRVVVGHPNAEGVTMGALVSRGQLADVQSKVAELSEECTVVVGGNDAALSPEGAGNDGAFYPPTLLYCADPENAERVHNTEAFGPVCTLMPYRDTAQAIALARRGEGSLAGSLFTADDDIAAEVILGSAGAHGRMVVINEESAKESTGHGSPLPALVHGGPGRAGGGEEMGGLRGVKHYMQRTAVQGSPTTLSKISREWARGAATQMDVVHPFRKYFEEVQIGDSLLTARRTVTEADIVNFACLSGDFFYAHMDEESAKNSFFGERVAHGYFIISAAAGLFVEAAPGPVIANYGMENLRFVKPVGIGTTIQVQLTCKKKIKKDQRNAEETPQGVIEWDVQVFDQDKEPVALYSIMTLVERKHGDFPASDAS